MSSWTNWPGGPSRTDNGITYNYVTAWEFIAQGWFAMNQRHAVLGGYPGTLTSFPPPNAIWDSGTIESVTTNDDGTITVTMTGVNWASSEGCSSPKWLDYSCAGCAEAHIPASYDLIIAPTPAVDTIDPRQTVRGNITGVTFDSGSSTGTLTITRSTGAGSFQALFPTDAATANYITSVASLAGQQWYILKAGGFWQSERLPDRPDSQQLWVGAGATGGAFTVASGVATITNGTFSADDQNAFNALPDGTYNTITDAVATWTPSQWVSTASAKEVLYWEAIAPCTATPSPTTRQPR